MNKILRCSAPDIYNSNPFLQIFGSSAASQSIPFLKIFGSSASLPEIKI
jgi:hypothetical protein